MTAEKDAPPVIEKVHFVPWYWRNEQLFAGVGSALQREFISISKKREYRRYENVFHASSKANDVYYVHSGLIKIYNVTPSGNVIIYWFCAPGALFGAGGITGSERQSVAAQAVRRSVVLRLPRAAFERLLSSDPQLALNVIRLMGSRLRLACDAVAEQATLDASARLARLLLHLVHAQERAPAGVKRLDQRRSTQVQITQQELADMSGMSRQTVNALLSDMKKKNLISTERGRVTIKKADEFIRRLPGRFD